MRLSKYFLPTLKENPAEAQIVSHRLMLRAGLVRQQAAGIYAWLPLGYRVLKKIEQIVREEQHRAGAERGVLDLHRVDRLDHSHTRAERIERAIVRHRRAGASVQVRDGRDGRHRRHRNPEQPPRRL